MSTMFSASLQAKGSFHQGSPRFDARSRGKQCMSNAILSIAVNEVKSASLWTSTDLDDILIAGDKIYLDINDNQTKHSYMLAKECPASVVYKGQRLIFDQREALHGQIFSDYVELPYVTLRDALLDALQQQDNGCIIIIGVYAIAVLCNNRENDTKYYVFDSHSRDERGQSSAKGTSVVMFVGANVEEVYEYIIKLAQSLGLHFLKVSTFEVIPIRVTLDNNYSVLSTENQSTTDSPLLSHIVTVSQAVPAAHSPTVVTTVCNKVLPKPSIKQTSPSVAYTASAASTMRLEPVVKPNYFELLYTSYLKANPEKTKKICQKEVTEIWNSIKKAKDVSDQVRLLLNEYEATAKMQKGTMLMYWGSQELKVTQPIINSSKHNDTNNVDSVLLQAELLSDSKKIEAVGTHNELGQNPSKSPIPKRQRPAEIATSEELQNVNAQLATLLTVKNTGLWTDEMKKKTSLLGETKKKLQQKLNRLRADRSRKLTTRVALKKTLEELSSENPTVAKKLQKLHRKQRGRPNLETDQPSLLSTIVDIVSAGAAADDRRRSEAIRSCKTLDDLHNELTNVGYTLSRSATYISLLPRNYNTTEGKRHVNTVPVKLVRHSNSLRKDHRDAHFAAATINYIKDLAALMGADCVFFLSQDDKARVPLGLPAANKQAPLLMHLEYKVQLPDHDWVVAERHKLIPSVYAGCVIKDGRVTYSGPTAAFIRSGKHDSSTAATHAVDFAYLLELDDFKQIACNSAGLVKPIVIVTVDGGPDENPRFPKTLNAAFKAFKDNNLDAIFIACHAPGHSAYNAVERRMAPLSHDLSGLILPYEYYGSHLDNNGKTTDIELEKLNFEKAGNTLAEVWSMTVIDGYGVYAKYIKPGSNVDIPPPSIEWCCEHVQQSQYCLQIIMCSDVLCCGQRRTNYNVLFPTRFLPAPVPYSNTEIGISPSALVSSNINTGKYGSLFQRLALANVDPHYDFKHMPFDLYCPSVNATLHKRICTVCGKYFASQIAVRSHSKACHQGPSRFIDDPIADEDEEDECNFPVELGLPSNNANSSDVVIVRNLFEWLQSEFISE